MKKISSIHTILSAGLGVCALTGVLMTDTAQGAILRYRLSGDWAIVADGTGPGWGVNPNNSGAPGTSLPLAADVGRINWGNNTVTVTTTASVAGLANAGAICAESGARRFRLQSGYSLLTPEP